MGVFLENAIVIVWLTHSNAAVAYAMRRGKFLLIYICIFHVLSNLLLIYLCKLHWNLNTMFVCQVIYF